MIDDNVASAARFSIGTRLVHFPDRQCHQATMETINFRDGDKVTSRRPSSYFSFGKWKILRKIDEGGFGQVYKVENVVTKKMAALKAEPTEIEGGSALKLEMAVIRAITADGEKPHVPVVFHAAKRKRFCYMIMTLLGENLKELKIHCPKEFMTARTWSRIGIQCLYSVKLVHDYGFVHRDIKPNNFVMGYREDYQRARIVHILDFGLSRSYAVRTKNDKWVARRARSTAEFRGTLRYCSPNVHEKKEQGRRDDLWSLFYVLIELHCGLPWQTLRDKQKVEMVKMHISDKDLVLNFPAELHSIIPYLRTLNYYQRPDYSMFYDGLVALMKRVGAKASDPYDWEKPESVKHIQSQMKGPYAWENAAEFFRADPIKVNSPPPPRRERRRQHLNIAKALQLDGNVVRDQSDLTTASTVDKGSFLSEQTVQDHLSLVYGAGENASEQNHTGRKTGRVTTPPQNEEPNKEKENEDEIKQRPKTDDIKKETVGEAKLKVDGEKGQKTNEGNDDKQAVAKEKATTNKKAKTTE